MQRSDLPSQIFAFFLMAGLLLFGTPRQSSGQTRSSVKSLPLAELSRSVEELSKQVSPAVAQIFSTGFRINSSEDSQGVGIIDKTRSSGAAVILDADGYLITNAHVVESAAEVEVLLPELAPEGATRHSVLRPKGKLITAQVVGVDAETDLAVLKIPRQGLPYLQLGDSEHVRQGQLVLAFGSPLGLENSVSMGVVSAAARQVRADDPMIYIQTDTPINPGNSGGALVDMEGRLIGITTFILSQSGGSEGIGFAAPSNIVHNVYKQIRENGRVRRGTIGVFAQTITPELATGLALPQDWGVVLADILPGGPAERAGLKEGDVVLTLNGKPMENARQFEVNLYRLRLGDQVGMEVIRGDQHLSFYVAVTERPDDPERFAESVSVSHNAVPELGVLGITVDPRLAQKLPALRKTAGVLVAARTSNPFPGKERLKPGDVIYAVNRDPITNLEQLRAATAQLNSSGSVVVQVERDSKVRYLTLELERVRDSK